MAIPPIIPTGSPVANPPKLPAFPPRLSDATPRRNDSRPAMTSRQKTRMVLITALCLLILGAVAIYANRTFGSPRNSIRALALAIGRRDRDTVVEYVDAPALAESFRRCGLESFRREVAKQNSNDFVDRLLNPLGEQLATGLVEAIFTPDSVISMMLGESPRDAMKRGVAGYTDQTVDGFTKDGSPKAQAYGAVAKVLIRWAAGYVIDETKSAEQQSGEFNPNDYNVSAEFESVSRYLITVTRRNSDEPALGFVFKRHGLFSWKFTEVRLLPATRYAQKPPLALN